MKKPDVKNYSKWMWTKIAGGAIVFLSAMIILLGSFYTTQEGDVDIVKSFGEAKYQVGAGLHWKMPFRDSIETIDIRTRKNIEEGMSVATSEQMPAVAVVSFNWTIIDTEAISLFKKYGGLAQFDARILDARLKSAAKGSIAQFTAEEIIQNRPAVTAKIEERLGQLLAPYSAQITFDSVNLEDIQLPTRYIESIQAKQTAKNDADKAVQKLREQQTNSRQEVNSAEAKRDSEKALADGEAYKIQVKGDAEAEAIRAVGLAEAEVITAKALAIKGNVELVKLTEAERWDGQRSKWVTGGTEQLLIGVGDAEQ